MRPASGELPVPLGFLSFPNPLFSLLMMAVVMVLMNGNDNGRSVDYWLTLVESIPDEPVVPGGTANGKGWHIGTIEATRKGEIVDPPGVSAALGASRKEKGLLLPIGP